MSEISVETGLPVLPEDDLFWRVGEPRHHGIMFTEPPGAYIAIVGRTKLISTVERTIPLLFGLEIGFGTKPSISFQEKEIVRIPIERITTVDADVYNADEDEKIGIKEVTHSVRIYGEELTAELILEHAEKALKRYYEITKSRALLGDYPPKRLNTEV
jgi:hypothetical protein